MSFINRAEGDYTKYEQARLIGARALQLSQGAPMMLALSEEELAKLKFNPVSIARLEFEAGVLPIDVRRPAPPKAA